MRRRWKALVVIGAWIVVVAAGSFALISQRRETRELQLRAIVSGIYSGAKERSKHQIETAMTPLCREQFEGANVKFGRIESYSIRSVSVPTYWYPQTVIAQTQRNGAARKAMFVSYGSKFSDFQVIEQ